MSEDRSVADLATAEWDIKDPGDTGTIEVTKKWGVVGLVSAAAETRTLNAPSRAGQMITLTFVTDNGNITVTSTAQVNQAGNTTMTFASVQDTIQLFSIPISGGYEWTVMSNDGVALT